MKLIDSAEMKRLEKSVFNDYLLPSIVLMENAARSFFDALKNEYGDLSSKKIAVFCGKGNNGGDGFAISRYLQNAGGDITVFLLCDKNKLAGDALSNYNIIRKMNIPVKTELSVLDNYDIIVDAIFGIGFHGEVGGIERSAIGLINESKAYVASVDIPSGAISENGKIGGMCVRADLVVTFGFGKIGLYLYPAKSYVKKVVVADISIPKDVVDNFTEGAYLLNSDILRKLPERYDYAHKGNFGRLLCVCGSFGMTGACELAATAALKSGAGLITAAAPYDASKVLASKFTEIMTMSLSENADDAADEILGFNKDVVLLGCGIGRSEYAKRLADRVISRCEKPMVIDADGINALLENINLLRQRSAPAVLTPHIVEFSRLLGISADEVMEDRINLALRFAKENKCVLVLKSADTVVALPDGKFYILSGGNSGMAKGGSGDVLAGLCASLMAQGASAEDAACVSVYLHSAAGFYAKADLGEYSMTAKDIIKYLPKAFGEKNI